MSEWLTTGQMVDKLKVGEAAEVVASDILAFVGEKVKSKNDLQWIWVNDEGRNEEFYLSQSVKSCKWRILPKYVTFEEAMKALKDDKEVRLHRQNGLPFIFKANDYFTFKIENLPFGFFTMHELFEGKWQIIE